MEQIFEVVCEFAEIRVSSVEKEAVRNDELNVGVELGNGGIVVLV